jgi:hypothetical protein
MLTIEQIMARFTTQRTMGTAPNPTPITRAAPKKTPVIINGMDKLLRYLADIDKRLTALEDEVKQRK